jgi:aspartyl-tRNA(Asn)/glutamyl-tRNA(Gln) amidotransferase subunit B
MRSKEEAHDYRYFPEPDLAPLRLEVAWIDAMRQTLPELPDQRRVRLVSQYGLPEYDAGVLTQSMALADYFEAAARAAGNPKAASNWIMGEVLRTSRERHVAIEDFGVSPEALAGLIQLVDAGAISSTIAKSVFERMLDTGAGAAEIVRAEGLAQVDDDEALAGVVRSVLEANPGPVSQYRAGRTATFGFLVGQVMKAAGGRANPRRVNEILKRALEP